jgi:hypothetical protein
MSNAKAFFIAFIIAQGHLSGTWGRKRA